MSQLGVFWCLMFGVPLPDHKVHTGYARVEEYDAIGQKSKGLIEGVKSARLKDVNINIPRRS